MSTIKDAEEVGKANALLSSNHYSLANFCHDRNEYAKAATQYERALRLKEDINGSKQPDIAATLQRHARLLAAAKRLAGLLVS